MRFSYQRIFVSSNSNTTSVANETGTGNPSGAPEFTPLSGVPVAQSLCVVLCGSLFVYLFFFLWSF